MRYGQRHVHDSFLLCFNAHDAALDFQLPGHDYGQKRQRVISTAETHPEDRLIVEVGEAIRVPDRSLVVLDRAV